MKIRLLTAVCLSGLLAACTSGFESTNNGTSSTVQEVSGLILKSAVMNDMWVYEAETELTGENVEYTWEIRDASSGTLSTLFARGVKSNTITSNDFTENTEGHLRVRSTLMLSDREVSLLSNELYVNIRFINGEPEPPVVEPDPDPVPAPAPAPAPVAVGSVFPGIPEYEFRNSLPALDATPDRTNCPDGGTFNGTPDNWLVVEFTQSSRCRVSGQYFVIQNSTLNHRLNISGGPYVIRNSTFDSPGTGGAINPSGTDILIEGNTILKNGVIPSSADHHGINVGGNTNRLWILGNHIYENSGDSIQFCHGCVGGVHNGPQNVYIAGNVMHDDEENAIDLKEFLGPVVVACNEMFGYESGQFSGNGEAIRVNDEGQQGELWIVKNSFSNNRTDIAPYNSDALGYYLDNGNISLNDNNNSNTQAVANGAAATSFYDMYKAKYGLDLSMGCPQ